MLILSFFIVSCMTIPGLVAFSRRSYDSKAAKYAFMVSGLIVWLIFNQTGSNELFSLPIRRIATYCDYATGPVIGILFFYFAYSFRGKQLNFVKNSLMYLALIFIELCLVTGFVVQLSVREGAIITSEKSLYGLYIAVVVAFVSLAVYEIFKSLKGASQYTRAQLITVFRGLLFTAFLLILSSFVLPSVMNDKKSLLSLTSMINLLAVLVFSVSGSLAIIKQRLFDVKIAAARAAVYTLSLGMIAALYGGALYFIGEKLFGGVETTRTIERFIFIIFAIITAAIFQPLRKFFDKITNFIFYRDAYNTGDFISELNKQLAQATNLDSFLLPTAKIIQKHLKTDYVTFGIREFNGVERRVVSTSKKLYAEEDILALWQATLSYPKQIINFDELNLQQILTPEEKILKKILKKYNIAILARLTDQPTSQNEGAGYLVLGSKKSGNAYNSIDTQVLEIIVNSLVLGIQNALRFEEIEQFNETLQQKIYSATKELKRSNTKLLALDEAKDEFISMASHQLRTPLTSVKGYLSMLAEGDAGKLNETQQQFISQSFISAQRMVYLISDLLNVSRLKTGKFVIEKVPTNLAEVVSEELKQLTESFRAKQQQLIFNKPADFPTVPLDETKLRQVIMNFCDNAIYYTPNGGTITVNIVKRAKAIEFTVQDTGIGVPKSEQHQLFTKFYRAGNARKVRPDGTGLGLFMAKKVIVAQGGSIIFRSQEGSGSTFGFTFPIPDKDS